MVSSHKEYKTSVKEEFIYIKEYCEIIICFFTIWINDAFLLLKNIKSDVKKFNMSAVSLIYNVLIKFPLLGFRPSSFFIYQFYKEFNRKHHNDYLSFTDHIKIAKENKHMPHLLDNKLQFHLYLHNKTQIPKLIAHFNPRNKKIIHYEKPSSKKVVIKPTKGKSGRGVKVVDSGKFVELLKERSEEYIVEEFVKQHHLINKIFSGSVNTVRIITLKKNNKEYVVVKAILRVGQKQDVFVDNNVQGGLTIGIDMSSGRLRKGYTFYEFGYNEYVSHPKTKYKFYGKTIPFFNEVQELAISAHKCIPMFTVVGWDIAITENGPVIIEGNRTPDVSSIQPHYPIKNQLTPTVFK